MLGWGATGAAFVVTAALFWASTTEAGISGLWYVLYRFRSDAAAVVFSHSLTAPISRLSTIGSAAVGSGLVLVLAGWAVVFVRRRCAGRADHALSAAVVAMLAVGIAGVALGASYWVRYLVV